jgi:hypothetical protein
MRKPLAHLGKSAAFKKALVIRICIPESESATFTEGQSPARLRMSPRARSKIDRYPGKTFAALFSHDWNSR